MTCHKFKEQGEDEEPKSYSILNFWRSIRSCKAFAALMDERYGDGHKRLEAMKSRVCKNHKVVMPEIWKNNEKQYE